MHFNTFQISIRLSSIVESIVTKTSIEIKRNLLRDHKGRKENKILR